MPAAPLDPPLNATLPCGSPYMSGLRAPSSASAGVTPRRGSARAAAFSALRAGVWEGVGAAARFWLSSGRRPAQQATPNSEGLHRQPALGSTTRRATTTLPPRQHLPPARVPATQPGRPPHAYARPVPPAHIFRAAGLAWGRVMLRSRGRVSGSNIRFSS